MPAIPIVGRWRPAAVVVTLIVATQGEISTPGVEEPRTRSPSRRLWTWPSLGDLFGYDPTTVTTTTKKTPFDCIDGYEDAENRWSEERRRWCCNNVGSGCPRMDMPTTTTTLPYDCKSDSAGQQFAWPAPKVVWCCERQGRGCQVPIVPTTREVYDCQAGVFATWSARKRDHCCVKGGVHCWEPTTTPTTTTTTTTTSAKQPTGEYDCGDGLAKSEAGWSDGKKWWCCLHFGMGCRRTPKNRTTAAYDCSDRCSDWERAWSDGQKWWCCAGAMDHGCPCGRSTTTTTTTPPYDCLRGDSSGWSEGKRAWCCAKEFRGCTGCAVSCVVHGVPASCRDRVFWAEKNTFQHERDACGHAHRLVREECPSCSECTLDSACPAGAATPEPHDCSEGEPGWSAARRAWCCDNRGEGCPTNQTGAAATPTLRATERRYDCQAGILDWEKRWTSEKAEWCCRRYTLGCHAQQRFEQLHVDVAGAGRGAPRCTGPLILGAALLCALPAMVYGFRRRPASSPWGRPRSGSATGATEDRMALLGSDAFTPREAQSSPGAAAGPRSAEEELRL